MSKQPPFDIYPKLDEEIQAATKGHPDRDTGLNAAVVGAVNEWAAQGLEEQIQEWADKWSNFQEWTRYKEMLKAPDSLEELSKTHSSLSKTLERLYWSHQAISSSGEQTSNFQPLEIAFDLCLMPWDAMRANLHDIDGWMKNMREVGYSDPNYIVDYMDPQLSSMLDTNKIYIDPDDHRKVITAAEYLDKKIATDGPWGIMLVQATQEAGTNTMLEAKSLAQRTQDGTQQIILAEQPVDAMGIFEWLALTLQRDPHTLSNIDQSMLPANRFEHIENGERKSYVPYALWLNDKSNILPIEVHTANSFLRPRLAVA